MLKEVFQPRIFHIPINLLVLKFISIKNLKPKIFGLQAWMLDSATQ